MAASKNQLSDAEKIAVLRRVLDRMKLKSELPAFSPHITELTTLASREDTSATQLADVILRDHALTTKILRTANGAVAGDLQRKIGTVSHAVAMLGFDTVRRVALGLMLLDTFQAKNAVQALQFRRVTLALLVSGLVARALADGVGLDPEEAFVAAMMRGLGRLVVIIYFPSELEKALALASDKGISETAALERVLGIPVELLGQILANHWKFPPLLVEAMAPLGPGSLAKPVGKGPVLGHLAAFSDELVALARSASPDERAPALTRLLGRFAGGVRLTERQLRTLFYGVRERLADGAEPGNVAMSRSETFTTMLLSPTVTRSPKTLEKQLRKRLDNFRKGAGFPALSADAALDELARSELAKVNGPLTDELRERIATSLVDTVAALDDQLGVEFVLDVIHDADEFVPPIAFTDGSATSMGLALAETIDDIGSPATRVLMVMVGWFEPATTPQEWEPELFAPR